MGVEYNETTIEDDDGPPSLASSSEDEEEDEEASSEDDDRPSQRFAASGDFGPQYFFSLVSYHAYNRCDAAAGCCDLFAATTRIASGAREAREAENTARYTAEVFRAAYMREHPTSRVILSTDHGPVPWNEGSTERVGGENTSEFEQVD